MSNKKITTKRDAHIFLKYSEISIHDNYLDESIDNTYK